MSCPLVEDIDLKTCRCCGKDKIIEEFVWMPSMPDNRNHTCRSCVSLEEYNLGIFNKSALDALCANSGLKRKDVNQYPDLVDSKKYNLLIKRALK